MFITPPLELDTAIFDGWDTLTGMAHLYDPNVSETSSFTLSVP